MSSETNRKSLFEKGIDLNKSLDKAMIVGGAVVGLAFNPLLGGAIIGGSIISMQAGDRLKYEVDKRSSKSRQLGQVATKDAYRPAA